jgi:hypothetical protein
MKRYRLTRTAALGLALAALAAPTASARPADLRSQADTSSLAGTTSAAPRQDLRSPDTRDYAEGRGTFNAPEVTVVKVAEPAPPTGGIDWGDASIGAGGMLGLTLLALGSSVAVVHRRHSAAGGQPTTTA